MPCIERLLTGGLPGLVVAWEGRGGSVSHVDISAVSRGVPPRRRTCNCTARPHQTDGVPCPRYLTAVPSPIAPTPSPIAHPSPGPTTQHYVYVCGCYPKQETAAASTQVPHVPFPELPPPRTSKQRDATLLAELPQHKCACPPLRHIARRPDPPSPPSPCSGKTALPFGAGPGLFGVSFGTAIYPRQPGPVRQSEASNDIVQPQPSPPV